MTQRIEAVIGGGFLFKIFGGKSFLHCLIEIVKNARDWGATSIQISTDEKHLLKIVDNGDGMNAKNRNAFASINTTTATGTRQSGQFCTGTKQMLFSQANAVAVRTVTKESPGKVISFTFTADGYEKLVLEKGAISPKVEDKSPQNWPYDHEFGVEIIYELSKPNRKSIIRGDVLARELSARLPMKFTDIVSVDGETLPEKELVGSRVVQSLDHKQIGPVYLEFYRPVKKSPEEDLRIGSVEIGEASMRNLYSLLRGAWRDIMPSVYLLPDVCGTVCASFFKDYANEDRNTLKPEILDDPRLPYLLQLLAEHAPEVEKRLLLCRKAATDQSEISTMFQGVADRFNSKYGKDRPRASSSFDGAGERDDKRSRSTIDSGSPPAMHFRINQREFEPGEEIQITPVFRKDIVGKYPLEDLKWVFPKNKFSSVKIENGMLIMKAKDLGQYVVTADIPGTSVYARISFMVVSVRIFQISAPIITIHAGNRISITTKNADKLNGCVEWFHSGQGDLEPQGEKAVFQAAHNGIYTVEAYDSERPDVRACCEITVISEPTNLICVKGVWFAYDIYSSREGELGKKPISMVSSSDINRLYLNIEAPGCPEAFKSGEINTFLLLAIAMEFVLFQKFTCAELDLSEINPSQIQEIMTEINREGYEIFAEISV